MWTGWCLKCRYSKYACRWILVWCCIKHVLVSWLVENRHSLGSSGSAGSEAQKGSLLSSGRVVTNGSRHAHRGLPSPAGSGYDIFVHVDESHPPRWTREGNSSPPPPFWFHVLPCGPPTLSPNEGSLAARPPFSPPPTLSFSWLGLSLSPLLSCVFFPFLRWVGTPVRRGQTGFPFLGL
jgi:hypothetical protein